jgi:hypothetical protein
MPKKSVNLLKLEGTDRVELSYAEFLSNVATLGDCALDYRLSGTGLNHCELASRSHWCCGYGVSKCDCQTDFNSVYTAFNLADFRVISTGN